MKKIAFGCSVLLASAFAQGSGLYFYEIGTEDTALAGAGQAARAQDASTIVTNPAGMTRLPDHMFTGGAQVMDGHIKYDMDNDNRRGPGNVMKLFPNASGFYSQKINDNLYAGIGLYGNYGLGIDFGSWAGDRLVKKSTMVAMTLSPSVAWKLNDRLSVGASTNLNYGFLSLTRNVDDSNHKETDHDWAMSYRLGLLMALTDQTRLGLSWTSKTDYHFNINATTHLPPDGSTQYHLPISAQVRAPQQLMLSLVHDLNQQWSVMGDLGWQDWSQFGSPGITVAGHTSDKTNRLHDTWHTALGVQYRPTVDWRLNAGVAYDSSVYRNQGNAAMTLPTGDEWRFATGAQYQLNPNSNIGMAVSYLHMQSARVSSPAVLSGSYNHPYLWFASVNYSYQF